MIPERGRRVIVIRNAERLCMDMVVSDVENCAVNTAE